MIRILPHSVFFPVPTIQIATLIPENRPATALALGHFKMLLDELIDELCKFRNISRMAGAIAQMIFQHGLALSIDRLDKKPGHMRQDRMIRIKN